MTSERELRVKYLSLLLRHAILAGLGHLNAPSPTADIELTTFLLTQLAGVIEEMGVFASRDLNAIVPLIRSMLMDPFTIAAPTLVGEAIRVLEAVILSCEERVRERWWGDVLRGCVGCWCNCVDEEGEDRREKDGVKEVKGRLRDVVEKLGEVVEAEAWKGAKKRLIEEEDELEGLFEGT